MNRIAPVLAILLAATAVSAAPEPDLPPLPDPVTASLPPPAEPPLRLAWNKLPLPITLSVGRERLVTFPVRVRVGLPPDLGADVLRTQVVDGTIYWTALQSFSIHRVQVQSVDDGNTYLIDLAASESKSALPHIQVALPAAEVAPTTPVPSSSTQPDSAPPAPPDFDYVALTRLAAQHLYAPERLLRVPDGVHRVPVSQASPVDLMRGGGVQATPLIAWRAGALYVTALKLRNTTGRERVLDPRRLRGVWRAATFQHRRLWPAGDLRDTSAAYLISSRPFEEAIDAAR